MAKTQPRGRDEVVAALLRSARKLVAQRGPSVSLRDIADDANVTFGLLHHYLGTKDQLVDIVYRAGAESMAERLAKAEHVDEAVDRIMRGGDGTTARLIGWAVLEGRGSDPAFRDSPALTVLADLLRRDAGTAGNPIDDEDARVFAAFVMIISIGWRLFAETALLAAGVEDPVPEHHTERTLDFVRQLATAAVSGFPQEVKEATTPERTTSLAVSRPHRR